MRTPRRPGAPCRFWDAEVLLIRGLILFFDLLVGGDLVRVRFFRYLDLRLTERRLVIFVQRVHEELVCPVRLASPLRLEAVEEDVSLAVGNLDCGGFSLDLLRM